VEKRTISTVFIICALLNACTVVGPDYAEPKFTTEDNWFSSERAEAVVDERMPIQIDWWQVFNDPLLSKIIEQAAQNNLDIKIAEANIRKARAIRSGKGADYYPSIESSVDVMRESLSENGRLPASSIPGIASNRTVYEAGFDASWELDFFGGTQRSVEAADARLDSAIESRRDIVLSILAETMRNYIELRGTQRRIVIMKQNIKLQKKTVEIVKQRYDFGDASEFELTRAEVQLRLTEASLPNLTADLRASAYRLTVLTGQEPQVLLEKLLETKPLPVPPDIVPVGLRSDILRRRPDIRLAERQLAAETADIGVATANLFPKFALTGTVGVESLSFGDLFQSTSTFWALGPLIRWPIFQGGAIRSQIAAEKVEAEAAAIAYERAVLTALTDAETALVRYGQELETRKRLNKAVDLNKHSAYLAKQRYRLGEDNILSVVDAEHELSRVEDKLVISETHTLINLVSLFKTLGGGWEVFESKRVIKK